MSSQIHFGSVTSAVVYSLDRSKGKQERSQARDATLQSDLRTVSREGSPGPLTRPMCRVEGQLRFKGD